VREFAYQRVTDAAAAVAADGTYLAGGTNLVDLMKLGVAAPDALIDVSRLDASIEADGDGVRIGAAARNADVARDERVPSLLRQALLAGASPQLRNVATVGGNLLQRTRCPYFQDVTKPCNKRESGTGCPAIEGHHRDLAIFGHSEACVATHPGDMSVALAALGATVHTDRRDIAIPGLHRLPEDAPERDTVLEPGELITAISVADVPGQARYRKVRDRSSYAFALVSIASVFDGTEARIALGGVAHVPWRCARAEATFRETGDAAAAADAELADARPLRDNAFKVTLARNLIVEALS
jgi:xanthine dehydrogenase YagS FAD-binding subunit